MIYTSGVVTVLLKPGEKITVLRSKKKWITLTKIKEGSVKGETDDRVRYTFTAILPKDFYCRSLEDYTGRVKPFIQQAIKPVIVSVHVVHLNYLSEKAIQQLNEKK